MYTHVAVYVKVWILMFHGRCEEGESTVEGNNLYSAQCCFLPQT